MQPESHADMEQEAGCVEARRALSALLREQRLGMLSTQQDGEPHASLVAFAGSEDLSTILFATSRATRKFANIESDPRVAMLIHNACDLPVDFTDATATTAKGAAAELTGPEHDAAVERYARIHPHLAAFVASPSTALMCIEVASYSIVRRFQHVTELHLDR